MPFGNMQRLKFLFVMIIYPTIFGIFQYWIIDNFLKKSEKIPLLENDKNKEELNEKENTTLFLAEDWNFLMVNDEEKNKEIPNTHVNQN